MTKYVHIVQVHPVENGKVNLSKVEHEVEFDTYGNIDTIIKLVNESNWFKEKSLKAVYLGRVNDDTGELV